MVIRFLLDFICKLHSFFSSNVSHLQCESSKFPKELWNLIIPDNVQLINYEFRNTSPRCYRIICYEGGIDLKGNAADTRTEAQKHAMYELLKDLTKEYPDARILGHCELPHVIKKCPGFKASEFYADLQPENR